MTTSSLHALRAPLSGQAARSSEAIAFGSLAFAETVKRELEVKGMHCDVKQAGGTYALREATEAYGGEFACKNGVLTAENTTPWQKFVGPA